MMNRNVYCVCLLLGISLLVGPSVWGAVVATDGPDGQVPLQIHLPREVTVRDCRLNLGQVSVVRGPEVLAAKASLVGLGRLSLPGQTVVLDRTTILSRLASSGIAASQVRLTGAKAIAVSRQQKIIEDEDFIEIGRQFLKQYPTARLASETIVTTRPKDLVLDDVPQEIELTPKLARSGGRGHALIQIQVLADGQVVGTRNVSFRMRFPRHRLVTTEPIPEGAALTEGNVKIETTVGDQPEPAGWKPPYGSVAMRPIPADTEIRQGMIGAARSAIVVRRNEVVQIRIERPGILITAMGTALQEAHAGECLKVRNADSRRTILCRVRDDGAVEPVL
jgi:flagella basal body P-ring formation protein FlgA